jgi:hypothetical protein
LFLALFLLPRLTLNTMLVLIPAIFLRLVRCAPQRVLGGVLANLIRLVAQARILRMLRWVINAVILPAQCRFITTLGSGALLLIKRLTLPSRWLLSVPIKRRRKNVLLLLARLSRGVSLMGIQQIRMRRFRMLTFRIRLLRRLAPLVACLM